MAMIPGERSMVTNRSVPTAGVLPHLVYEDVAGAIAWLSEAFGVAEHYRYGKSGGPVQGAQLRLGDAWIQLVVAREGRASPAQCGLHTQSLTVFVEDVAAHLDRARAAGAVIVEELNETPYGDLQYGAEDLEGHRWLFSRHVRDVAPQEWGATVVDAGSIAFGSELEA